MPVIGTPCSIDSRDGLEQSRDVRTADGALVLPSDLGSLVQGHEATLEADVHSRSYLEALTVRKIARHAASLDVAHACEQSIFRSTELAAGLVSPDVIPSDDARRIAAINNPGIMRVVANQAAHARVERCRSSIAAVA
jgi:hypothetical protein